MTQLHTNCRIRMNSRVVRPNIRTFILRASILEVLAVLVICDALLITKTQSSLFVTIVHHNDVKLPDPMLEY